VAGTVRTYLNETLKDDGDAKLLLSMAEELLVEVKP
jgi:hypothetical protein